jgi:hypothetical protein
MTSVLIASAAWTLTMLVVVALCLAAQLGDQPAE